MAWKAGAALAAGAVFGLLVAIPYKQWFGVSSSLCAILHSLAATVALTSLTVSGAGDLVLEMNALPQRMEPPTEANCFLTACLGR